MQNSPNLLNNKENTTNKLSKQYTQLTQIANYQADFWLMLLSSFVASFSFWVLIDVVLPQWQFLSFLALFSLSVILVLSYGKLTGLVLFSGLVLVLLSLKYFLIPWVETNGGYEGAIFLLILVTLSVFKMVHLAQIKMRLKFSTDHPLANSHKICQICLGEGVLNSFQPYLEKNFIQEVCYGCGGEGIISEDNFVFRIQHLLAHCEKNRFDLEKQAEKLENAHYQIMQKLSVKEGVLEPGLQIRLQESSQSYSQQLNLTHKQLEFYKASEEKMHIMLYNQHVAEELNASQKTLEEFQINNEKHHQALDFIQMQLEQENQLNTETEALKIDYDLNAQTHLGDVDLIMQKIEEITCKIRAL